MTGCVQKGASAVRFMLTNTEAKGPKRRSASSSPRKTWPRTSVALIAITGTDVPRKEAESAKPTPPKADHYMKVTSIKMVSTTCK